jgi:cytochrome P450 family 142 subfamily A polypeptide 1
MQPAPQARPIDLLDPDTHGPDALEVYDWLREHAPMYWDPINEIWCVSRYDDVIAVSRDPDTFTSSQGNLPKMPPDPSFINTDGHIHRIRRGAIQHLFSPRAIAKLESHVRDATHELIDAIIETGAAEFVNDVAAPLPMRIVGEMTGIPAEFHDDVRAWLDVFGSGGDGPTAVTEEVNEAFLKFGGLHMMLVEERLAEPKDDLLSLWIHTEFDGQKLDDEALLFEHTMLVFGGSETTRNVISGGLEMLARHPDQRALLLARPDLIPNAVEEMVRWVSPFVRMSRTATRDAELGGVTIREGEEILMLYPAANRDPRKFDHPERFDVAREFKNKPISFGYGRHFCLGAHLARMEARVVLEAVLARMPDFQLTATPEWTRSSFVRGPRNLPLAFTPGPRRNGG